MPTANNEHDHHRKISEREQRLEAILTAASDAIIAIDRNGIIESVNPAAERMFGYSVNEMIGQNVSILIPAPIHEKHDSYIRRYLDTRTPHILGIAREVSALRKDGSIFPAQLSVAEVDHLEIFIGIVHDVSDCRELQQHVLKISEQEQRRIGQDLHDNLQQELSGLSLMAQTLHGMLGSLIATQERPVDSAPGEEDTRPSIGDWNRAWEMSERIHRGLTGAVQRVRQISHGILPTQVDAHGFRSSLEQLTRETNEIEGIECRLSVDESSIVSDTNIATNLYRIVQESVNNAIRHGRATKIQIDLRYEDGLPGVEISDNGTGFDPKPVHEGKAGDKPKMGLRIMEYRARTIGAVFYVESRPGKGTRVWCQCLPGTTLESVKAI